MRPRTMLCALHLTALAGACSPEKPEAPLSDPQDEALTGPTSASTAAMAAGGDTMTIVEVVPTGGGWPWIDAAAYWDPPIMVFPFPAFEDFPLRIVSKNEQGATLRERVITMSPDDDEWDIDLVLMTSMLRADLLHEKNTDPDGYRNSVGLFKSGLAHESGRDSLAVAALLAELGEL